MSDTHLNKVFDKTVLFCFLLQWSWTVAGITEVPPVAMLPNFVVQKKVLKPFRFQTGGTVQVRCFILTD